ncbi:hypothetical protein BR93DRAFT_931070 [Coniochaeta sp. PMI_546]|nr:hypothetical protein BR93DRAFT_931070 [Coniochaeta sp. PMI_546]
MRLVGRPALFLASLARQTVTVEAEVSTNYHDFRTTAGPGLAGLHLRSFVPSGAHITLGLARHPRLRQCPYSVFIHGHRVSAV